MLRLRAVAGLAIDSRVLACLLHLEYIGMAGFAGFMPCMHHRQRGDFFNRIGPIVTVLPKAFRNKPGPHAQEEDDPDQEDPDHAEQVFGILESIHSCGG